MAKAEERIAKARAGVDAPMPRFSRAKIVRYYLLAVFVFYVWYQCVLNFMFEGDPFAFKNIQEVFLAISLGYPPLLALSLVNTYMVFSLGKKIAAVCKLGNLSKILVDFLLSLVAPVLNNLAFIGVSILLGKHGKVQWLSTFIINFMIFMINEVVYFMANYKRQEVLYERERRVASQLEYEVLRTQVNPHFLFNALNILYSLTSIDMEKSREFVLSLSKMYRYIMIRRDSLTVSLCDEMEFLHNYTDVLKIVYYRCFDIEISGEEHIASQRVVPYSLQLLIENVTKHNVINAETPMKVSVKITPASITVSNPLRPKEGASRYAESTGIGLHYLREIYQMNGRETIVTDSGDRFEVTVPLLPDSSLTN